MPLLSTRDSIVCEFLAFMMCICMYSFETGALWGCVAIQKYLHGVLNVNTSVWKAQEMT